MNTSKYVTVSGEMVVCFNVELPTDFSHDGQACDDPAVEAALCAVNEMVQVFLWGQDNLPARVSLEVFEEDVTIEEDNRE